MEIRPLQSPDDLPGVIRAHGLAWQAAYEGLLPAEVLERFVTEPTAEAVQRWFDRVEETDERFLVAVDEEGEAVGYAYVRWGEGTKPFVGENEAGLKEIYVHPEQWGEGIGTALLEEAIAGLPDTVEALTLEMLAGNEVGEGFYEARGFDRVGENEFEMGEDAYQTDIYRLEL